MTPEPNPDRPVSEDENGCGSLEEAIAEYIDALNAGGKLDPRRILAEHPALGQEIIAALRRFLDLDDFETELGPPLGTLADYTLLRRIGRGGMGVVYEARENSMDRRVALKVLPPGIAADQKAFLRFMREAKTAGQLSHPSVVSVYAMGVKEQTPYYAMEYVEGETLAEILTRLEGAAPEVETPFGKRHESRYFVSIGEAFAAVADGLQHAHSKGVIHRDIKPSNLILDRESRLRILDFGLARLEGQGSLTVSGDLVGTVQYMSPEQARRKKIEVDHRTDIYSLGATMYEMLAGRPPFQGKDHQDTLSQIIERDPRAPRQLDSRIPRELETIVLKCLRKDPADRYGTAEALAQDLRRFVRGDPIEARPQARWERLARRLRRHRWRLLAAATFVVLAISLAVMAYERWQAIRAVIVARYEPAILAVLKKIYADQFSERVAAGETRGVAGFAGGRAFPVSPEDIVRLAKSAGSEDLEEQVRELERAVGAVERADGHYHLARAYRLLERTEEARREARRALERDADFVPAEVLEVELSGSPKDRKRLDVDKLRSRYEGRECWQRSWLDAYAAMRDRDWSKAADACGRLIALGEGGKEPYVGAAMEAYVGRGLACLQAKNYRLAIEDFLGARVVVPGLEPTLLLGKTYFLKDEKEDAEETFERLYDSVGPGEKTETALWVAAAYDSVGGSAEGLRWAEKLGDEIPVKERLRSHFLYRLGRRGEAIEAGRRAAERNPGDPAACEFLALSLLEHVWCGPGPRRGRKLLEAYCASRTAQDADPADTFARSLVSTTAGELRYEVFKYLRTKAMNAHGLARALVAVPLALAAPRAGEGQDGFFDDLRRVDEIVSMPERLEFGAELSADGRELFYAATPAHLVVATREGIGEPWTSVRPVDELNGHLPGTTLTARSDPSISSNGRDLYFAVMDSWLFTGTLWMATRSDRSAPFTNPRPLDEIHGQPLMQAMTYIWGPDISADDLELFFCAATQRGVGGCDLYVATREEAGAPFTSVRALSEINLPGCDGVSPQISSDGLTLFWSDADPPHRPGGQGSADLWMASRPARDKPFGAARNLGLPINSGTYDAAPGISADWPAAGSKLYFTRIPGASSTGEIYVATWHLDYNGNGSE